MIELALDEIEFSAMIVMLLWTIDATVTLLSVSEESMEIGSQQRMQIYEELHAHYTRHGTEECNYAHRLATMTSMVHAIDVRHLP